MRIRNYPQELKDKVGPRNMVHSWATDIDDPTVQPRWGKIGKQKIEDAGTLYPEADGDGRRRDPRPDASSSSTRRKTDNKPFFLWLNPTRMHVVTHLSEKYEKMRNSENGWTIEEAGMAQLDDIVGAVMKKLKDTGVDDNTIVVFTTDNGAENFTWPDGGQTPFAGGKGTVLEGGFRVPCIAALAGQGAGRQGRERHHLRARLVPDASSRRPATRTSSTSSSKGKQLGDRTYKVHLDGYDQTDLITGKGPSKRHEIFYFTESTLGAVRIDDYKYRFTDQPQRLARRHGQGRLADPDQPAPRSVRAHGHAQRRQGSLSFYNWFAYEFWRFVFVQAGSGEVRPDLHRVPADAEGRELQPGSREGRDREEDRGARAPSKARANHAACSAPPRGPRGLARRRDAT